MTIGEKIKRLRVERLLSQRGLAAAVGVDVQSVNRWERGRKQPSLRNLAKLCDALGITPTELWKGVDHPK